MPPQFYILSTLADILDGPSNTAEQRWKVQTLSTGSFGRMVVNPRRHGDDENGRWILTFEGDETRGGHKGRMHRVLVRMEKGVRCGLSLANIEKFHLTNVSQLATEISMIRNFDVFSEIQTELFVVPPLPAKL